MIPRMTVTDRDPLPSEEQRRLLCELQNPGGPDYAAMFAAIFTVEK